MRTRAQIGRFLYVSRELDPDVRSRVKKYVEWARAEIGDVPTSGQLGLLAALRLSLTVILMAEQDMATEESGARRRGRHPGVLFKTLNAYMTSFRHLVTALGLLERKGQGKKGGRKKPPELEAVIVSYKGRSASIREKKGKGDGK
jgi:hypothetical protein